MRSQNSSNRIRLLSSQSSGMPMGVIIRLPFVVAADRFGGLHPEKQHRARRIGHLWPLLSRPEPLLVSYVIEALPSDHSRPGSWSATDPVGGRWGGRDR